jgi:hypothetical protein
MQPLPPLEAMLAQADLSSFLQCRFVCRVAPRQQPQVSFHQLMVSIAALGGALLPGVDLAGQGGLKQKLAASAELRLLSMIERSVGGEFPSVIMLPLHLTTLLSEAFLSFDRRLPMARRGTIVIAVEAAEIFDNLTDWMIASSFLAARGYPICFIGTSPRIASLLHWRRLGADWIKVPFSDDDAVIRAAANGDDGQGVILGDTDTPRALDLGQAAGIRYFEGRCIDQLIRAHGGHRKQPAARPRPSCVAPP